ncbi:aminoglycoside phosphotransferase family protein [Sediminibacterium sp. KACHI17]|uniref:Aminoglycoside phosphotransferase family protein n=1 Tax=Sediminibacterium sp. KACHI17 TaxID=1751071 RepID=A0AAT9GES9_9BACT
MTNIAPPISVLEAYGLHEKPVDIITISNGLINHTWKLSLGDRAWILQRINTAVFKTPQFIQQNIERLGAFIQSVHPQYLFTMPLPAKGGTTMVQIKEEFYRLFSYIPDSKTITVVETARQAEAAAFQFGNFTRQFADFDCSNLYITIKGFHDLSFRYEQFQQSLQHGLADRIVQAGAWITQLQSLSSIEQTYKNMLSDTDYKIRVTHHDTKISNILFDLTDNGLCVIDLDTVMPGYFFSDLGDMFRTYLSPVNEEEQDLSLIQVRSDIYKAIVNGYAKGMGDILTEKERHSFFDAGAIMIYMQALRFMTDFLNGDLYYQIQYPAHNFERAKNQITLLQDYLQKKDELQP